MILRPEGGPRNHWISFELAGSRSNRLALNARVNITAGELAQTDEVRSGGSYLSQNDLRLHFGLGDHAKVQKVQVLWPSGTQDVLKVSTPTISIASAKGPVSFLAAPFAHQPCRPGSTRTVNPQPSWKMESDGRMCTQSRPSGFRTTTVGLSCRLRITHVNPAFQPQR